MKISISKTIEQELEVPKFWTNPKSDGVFKLLDDEYCLMALPFKHSPFIAISSINMNFSEDSIEITEEQFNSVMEQTKQTLGI
jgi:hypothetical protein